MWWIVGLAIVGIFGIAQVILDSLREEVARERKQWEESYQTLEAEVRQYQRLLDQKLKVTQSAYNCQELIDLHHVSTKAANSTYSLLEGSRKTLDAMGRAIVNAAKQRKQLERRKRNAWPWEAAKLEKEIRSLHKLRDEILIPDKDKVKAQRNRLLGEVRRLNKQTAQLRDMIRDHCGSQGVAWYNALMKRTEIRRENRERAKAGLPPLPLPSSRSRLPESRVRGKVKWYDRTKGFGFIIPDTGQQDVYVGQKNLQGISYLNKGDRVEFVIRKGAKGPWAAKVVKL